MAVDTQIQKVKQTARLSERSFSDEQLQIMAALTSMATKRDALTSASYLQEVAIELSRANSSLALRAVNELSRRERIPGETGLPSLGTILRVMRELDEATHPLCHLRRIVRKLCVNFGEPCTEERLELFQEVAGHRTDADLDAAYREIVRDETIKRMPTAGVFLKACGLLRVRRDGTKPE